MGTRGTGRLCRCNSGGHGVHQWIPIRKEVVQTLRGTLTDSCRVTACPTCWGGQEERAPSSSLPSVVYALDPLPEADITPAQACTTGLLSKACDEAYVMLCERPAVQRGQGRVSLYGTHEAHRA